MAFILAITSLPSLTWADDQLSDAAQGGIVEVQGEDFHSESTCKTRSSNCQTLVQPTTYLEPFSLSPRPKHPGFF